MDGDAVKALAEQFREPVEIGEGFIAAPNDWTVRDPKSLVAPGPSAEALKVYSLGALRDYLQANRDALDLTKVVVHVVSPQVVRLNGPLQERARNRESYIEASAQSLTDGFMGKFMALDEFMVGLLTRFADTDDRKTVLRLFGNVKHEGVKGVADDGVTQTVTAKTGIVLGENVPVPSSVTLTPYRTFREVDQPPSPFVLRVTASGTGTLSAGMFEADGGAWRLSAIESIARWLRAAVPDTVSVLA